MTEERVIKAQSVSKARAAARNTTNKYIRQYGELAWMAALLTAYQGGGYEDLKYNYEHVPLKYLNMLLEAYRYKNTELELIIAQAAARPYLKKNDAIKYMQSLTDKLEGTK